MRTQEEILAQCEARYKALEAEAAERRDKTVPNPERPFCSTCKWAAGRTCHEPLVKGLGKHTPGNMDMGSNCSRQALLCGSERALWVPKGWEPSAGLKTAVVVAAIAAVALTPFAAIGFFFGWSAALASFIVLAVVAGITSI